MTNGSLQMHCDKPVTMNVEFLLGETILPEEAAWTVRKLLAEFCNWGIPEENFRCHGSTFSTVDGLKGIKTTYQAFIQAVLLLSVFKQRPSFQMF